ncbi:MAG: tetratricopeptide repeat protein [Gammaproteobacteria bacterium]|nr:MAG: tetratricopeptide repeat protein [Gammaproteobacteria bacterium]
MKHRFAFWVSLLCVLQANAVWASGAFDQSRDGFVNNDQCLSCHARQAFDWRASDHANAMQPANDATVLGNFAGSEFEGEGLKARFHRDNGQFLVTFSENGRTETLTVAWTFGIDPLQQYLVTFPNGQLQAFPVAWDTKQQRWFHLQAGDDVTPTDPLHWRKRFFIANSFCIECHTTNFKLGYDPDTSSYHSTASGHNVNCQACHGPGEAHLQWTRSPNSDPHKGWNPQVLRDPQQSIALCADCHARRHLLTPARSWAAPLLDEIVPTALNDALYYPDGQIRDEVFEYSSFAQSRMHEAGLSCLDCHNPHTLKPRAEGNALCTSCHEVGNARFPSLKAATYNSPAHHHHADGSSGSQCVSCHMPATTYMKVDPRRDHRFGTPRPDTSKVLGTPNACNQCHADQSVDWAIHTLDQWFPQGRHTQPDTRALALAAARAGRPEAIQTLKPLLASTQQPAIWRATLIDALALYGPALLNSITPSLSDPSPMVRAHAARTFELQPREVRQQYLPALLLDPVRAVRLESIRLLADIDPATLPANLQPAWQAALEEYRAAQQTLPDHPEGYANLGQLAYHQGNAYDAIRRMKQALEKDPHFIPAYQSLAVLYSQIGAYDRAIDTLQQAITHAYPEQQGELYYTLGLALAERQQWEAAAKALEQSIARQAGNDRVHYNLGLVLQQQGKFGEAITQLQKAVAIRDDDRSLYALLQLLIGQQRMAEAKPVLDTLLKRYPQDQDLLQMQQQLHRQPR